jgi:hypothetical protein
VDRGVLKIDKMTHGFNMASHADNIYIQVVTGTTDDSFNLSNAQIKIFKMDLRTRSFIEYLTDHRLNTLFVDLASYGISHDHYLEDFVYYSQNKIELIFRNDKNIELDPIKVMVDKSSAPSLVTEEGCLYAVFDDKYYGMKITFTKERVSKTEEIDIANFKIFKFRSSQMSLSVTKPTPETNPEKLSSVTIKDKDSELTIDFSSSITFIDQFESNSVSQQTTSRQFEFLPMDFRAEYKRDPFDATGDYISQRLTRDEKSGILATLSPIKVDSDLGALIFENSNHVVNFKLEDLV